MLLLSGGLGDAVHRPLSRSELSRRGIAGSDGVISVKIYDMRYRPGKVSPTLSPHEIDLLPTSINITSNRPWRGGTVTTVAPDVDLGGGLGEPVNRGIYLVRATLTLNGAPGGESRTWILDSAIIQTNNRPPEA